MKEWIEYHRLLGVEHFWLYNNNSTDNYKEILTPYIKEGIIELIEWPSLQEENDWKHFTYQIQTSAYNDAIQKSKKLTKWLAVIDLDEFIVPLLEDTISQCLEEHFKDFSGVCPNWVTFGTSHIDYIHNNDLMIEQLTYRCPINHSRNNEYKSIVKPKDVVSFNSPHSCDYSKHYAVNGDGVRLSRDGKNNISSRNILRINHYWTRDEYYLNNIKIPRYIRWGKKAENIMKTAEELNQEHDDAILRFVYPLKTKIQGEISSG